jgi:DNA mismatch repair ATPase MutS
MTPVDYYIKKKNIAENTFHQLKKKLAMNATIRLLAFLGVLGFLFGLVQFNTVLGISLSGVSLTVFFFFVRKHVLLQKEKKYFQAQLNILDAEVNSCNHIFTAFREGAQYRNPKHHFSHDLDLFGTGSLFQMINRTITQHGEEKLAKHLTKEEVSAEKILQLQNCFKELSEFPDQLLHFRTTGSVTELIDEDLERLAKWKDTKSYITRYSWLDKLRYLFPSLLFTALGLLIFTDKGTTGFISMFIINLILTGFFYRKTNKEHNKVSSFLKVIEKYADLMKVFEGHDFKCEALKDVSTELYKAGQNSTEAFSQIAKATNAFDSRMNIIAAIFLEGFLLWDFHCLFKIERWKKKYSDHLIPWMENIALLDSYISLSTFAYNNPDFCYPVLGNKVLNTKETGHPFIPSSVRINNDFNIDNKGQFVIITGANMAGKSTFLRTIGVNLVMGMSGLPVCAKSFEFTPRKMFTSMRTSDSLNENESYFYAELKRMKELIDMLEDGHDLFIMLDEILKGTNSVDKQKGSQLALEKIINLKGTGIIATHDLALTKIEDKHPDIVRNKCFEIEIDQAAIHFAYKLYEGVTQNMNAMLLMEQMGIV